MKINAICPCSDSCTLLFLNKFHSQLSSYLTRFFSPWVMSISISFCQVSGHNSMSSILLSAKGLKYLMGLELGTQTPDHNTTEHRLRLKLSPTTQAFPLPELRGPSSCQPLKRTCTQNRWELICVDGRTDGRTTCQEQISPQKRHWAFVTHADSY